MTLFFFFFISFSISVRVITTHCVIVFCRYAFCSFPKLFMLVPVRFQTKFAFDGFSSSSNFAKRLKLLKLAFLFLFLFSSFISFFHFGSVLSMRINPFVCFFFSFTAIYVITHISQEHQTIKTTNAYFKQVDKTLNSDKKKQMIT